MVEYRGYGLSEGSPSERGLYVDAQSALDYIMQRTDIDVRKLIVFGRSLGWQHLFLLFIKTAIHMYMSKVDKMYATYFGI